MRTEELMQNDWVRLSAAPIFCKVRSILDDGTVQGLIDTWLKAYTSDIPVLA